MKTDLYQMSLEDYERTYSQRVDQGHIVEGRMRNIYRNQAYKTLHRHPKVLPKVLNPPLDPFAMRAKYFPAGKLEPIFRLL